jgi:predicted DsbA family dithiol-disulfide isomerase
MAKKKIQVDVVSDVVCPWCYIGKRRLEKAMETLRDEFEFDVTYQPFELNPEMPVQGANQRAYLTKKFGNEARYQQITGHVAGVAKEEGLEFDFEKQHVAPNTRLAHRLLLLAKQEGYQLALKEAFLKAYFTDGVDLSRPENLQAICVEVGLDAAKVEAVIKTSWGEEEVVLTEQLQHQRGVTGVPFYIINNKYGVSGAQPAATFQQIFQEVAAELDTAAACDVEQKNC